MIQTTISEPIYRSVLNIYAAVSNDEFNAEIRRRFPDLEDCHHGPTGADARFRVVFSSGGVWYFVWVRHFSGDTQSIANLSHEIFHYTAELFRHRGLGFSPDSEEAWAYFHTFVLAEAIEGLKRELKKKVKKK